jgi:hypothetical protein
LYSPVRVAAKFREVNKILFNCRLATPFRHDFNVIQISSSFLPENCPGTQEYPEFDEQEEDEDDQENHRALQNCFEVENHKVKEEAESEGDYPKFSQIFVHDKENGVKSESKDDL